MGSADVKCQGCSPQIHLTSSLHSSGKLHPSGPGPKHTQQTVASLLQVVGPGLSRRIVRSDPNLLFCSSAGCTSGL
ncbi:hypothetical protein AAFF_G00105080 [Aldrovandia affinis]|uniref:Uncharacterized protein n=1 Tax=Aldrovandia affinis TaxID=143900 RepID=A0AAD7T3T0_9TELE|nr:hypothetical protein AAFF_G00105080 [Aldrovandia affinis]